MPTLTHEFRMLIGGQFVSGANARLEVINPATEEVLALAPNATDADIDAAVAAARAAFDAWSRVPVIERAAAVRVMGDILLEHREELARLLTAEQGKPLANAIAEVERAAKWCHGLADLDVPWEAEWETETHNICVRRVPLGVVAAIVPWNFPVTLAFWKIAPALLAGNTIVVKPSPFTPLTSLRIAELVGQTVPPGVVNYITGDDSLGPRLSAHSGISKIAFTGSTVTGKRVMETASRNLVRVTLELGGNDPAIVLPDVDIDEVVPKLFFACFANSAQFCIAAKRVYVHNDIYDEFGSKMAAFAASVVVGDGLEPTTQLGPIQNRAQYEKVLRIIEDCVGSNMQFIVPPDVPKDAGFFIRPCIVDNPPDDSAIVKEEPFGPIVPFLRYNDLDEVVRRANDSEFGLAASVWGSDISVASNVASKIEAGVVWINEVHRLSPDFPFGGRKLSGLGAENGVDGILAYTDTNVISTFKG